MNDFAPTHAIPDNGLPAWVAPDPSNPAVATLAAATPVRVAERRGDWARVEVENGWSGWVDGRLLVVVAPGTPPPPPPPSQAPPAGPPRASASSQAPATSRPSPSAEPARGRLARAGALVPVAAGIVVAVTAFLPWLGGAKGNDVTAEFLYSDPKGFLGAAGTANYFGGSLKIGHIVLAIGIVGAVSATTSARAIRRVCGGLAVIVAAAFTIQLARFLDALGDGAPAFSGEWGPGAYLSFLGGIALLAPRGRGRA